MRRPFRSSAIIPAGRLLAHHAFVLVPNERCRGGVSPSPTPPRSQAPAWERTCLGSSRFPGLHAARSRSFARKVIPKRGLGNEDTVLPTHRHSRQARRSLAPKRVPKWSLGTRKIYFGSNHRRTF